MAARRALRARLDELARPDSPLPLESARGRIGGVVRFVEPRIVGVHPKCVKRNPILGS
jgi:hypothetical protein